MAVPIKLLQMSCLAMSLLLLADIVKDFLANLFMLNTLRTRSDLSMLLSAWDFAVQLAVLDYLGSACHQQAKVQRSASFLFHEEITADLTPSFLESYGPP